MTQNDTAKDGLIAYTLVEAVREKMAKEQGFASWTNMLQEKDTTVIMAEMRSRNIEYVRLYKEEIAFRMLKRFEKKYLCNVEVTVQLTQFDSDSGNNCTATRFDGAGKVLPRRLKELCE